MNAAFGLPHDATLVTGSASADAPDATHVVVPDAHLLFHGDFKRAGFDLTLTDDQGHRFVVPGYFKHENLPSLLSPAGAALSGEIIAALAGPRAAGQYAQATAPSSDAQPIGRVASADGNAIAVRNGVAVALNVGDAVLKGDVIQTQSNSSVGITFTDGTTFSLSSNARMVLNEFVYNPAAGSQNSALINLVQGSISFIAGEVAHSGDMKVGTPVATMGIRGTAVSVEISADNGATNFSVMMEPNGKTGSYVLYDNVTNQVIGTVSNAAVGWTVTPAGPLQVLAQQFDKPADVLAHEIQLVQQVLNIQAVGNNILQQTTPHPPDPNSNGSSGSSTPPGAPGGNGQSGSQGSNNSHTTTIQGTVTDENNNNTPVTVTIQVIPNVAPVINGGPPDVHFTGDGNAIGGYLTSPGATGGTLPFTDPDRYDVHSVTATLTGASWPAGSVWPAGTSSDDLPPTAKAAFTAALTAGIASDVGFGGTGTIAWSLAPIPAYLLHFLEADQTLTLTYTIQVTDGDGESSSVTFNVVLMHDSPAFIGWIKPGPDSSGDWNDPANWSTGTIPTADTAVHIPDEQIINGGGSYQVTNSADAAAKSILLQDPGAELINNGTLHVLTDLTLLAGSGLTSAGTLTVDGDAVVDHSTLTAAAGGHVIAASVALADSSAFNNDGAVTVTGALAADDSVIVNGAGSALASIGAASVALTASSQLTNSAAITIASAMTADASTVVNNAGGTIEAISATMTGGSSMTNAGEFDVSGDIALHASSSLSSSGILTIGGDATVDHSTLTAAAGGEITIKGNVVDSGTIEAAAGGTIDIQGATITNSAANGIALNGLNATLLIESQSSHLALTGGGGVALATGSLIIGAAGEWLENVNNVIAGAGQIGQGDGDLTLSNDAFGIVNATGALALNTGHSIANAGLLEATAGGTLTIYDDVDNTGTIVANDPAVTTDSSVHLYGTVINSNLIEAVDGGKLYVEGTVENSATIQSSGGGVIIVAGAGTIVGSGGISGDVENDGAIEAHGLLHIFGNVTGTGVATIGAGATLEIEGSFAPGVIFSGADATLRLDAGSVFSGSIAGLAASDSIDLRDVTYGLATTGTYADGALVITDGVHTISLALTGDYANAAFAGFTDGHDGTLITLHASDDAPAITGLTSAAAERLGQSGDTGEQDTATGILSFTDIDLTDRPTASAAFKSFVYLDAHGDPLTADQAQQFAVAGLAVPIAVTADSSNANNGSADWTYNIADGALDFLAAGEKLILTYTATVDDHRGGTATQDFTVTLTDSNDAPVITQATDGAYTERPGVTGDAADQDTVTGTVGFADVDLTDRPTASAAFQSFAYTDAQGHTVTLSAAQQNAVAALEAQLAVGPSTDANNGSATWSFTVADAALDFLGAGHMLTLTYTATVTNHHGGTASQDFAVVLTGTDDMPTLAAVTGPTYSDTAVLDHFSPATGALAAADVDTAAVLTYGISGGAADNSLSGYDAAEAGSYGTLYLNSVSGAYSFVPDDTAINALAAHASETFTVFVSDGTLSAAQSFTVSLNGTNDIPTVAMSPVIKEVTQDAPVQSFTAASLLQAMGAADPDGDALKIVDLSLFDPEGHAVNLANPPAGVGVQIADDGSLRALSVDPSVFKWLPAGQQVTLTANFDASDGHGGLVHNSALLVIDGLNDTPSLAPVAGKTYSDTPAADHFAATIGQLTATDIDAGFHLTYGLAGAAADHSLTGYDLSQTGLYGKLFVNSVTGVYDFVPSDDAINALLGPATEHFTFTVSDGDLSAVQDFAVMFNGVNDLPTTVPVVLNPIAMNGGTRLIDQADLLANAHDIDGPSLTATGLVKTAGNGVLIDNGDGTWSYTPALNDDTAVSFSYTVSDGVAPPIATTATMDIGDSNDFDALADGTSVTTSGSGIFGTHGNDTIVAGPGNQVIYGGGGSDFITASDGATTVYSGSGNDLISGNAAADTLYGGSGSDKIIGGDGNDVIIGGTAADALTGGAGHDTFVFHNPADSLAAAADAITDFDPANDSIAIGHSLAGLTTDLLVAGTGNLANDLLSLNSGLAPDSNGNMNIKLVANGVAELTIQGSSDAGTYLVVNDATPNYDPTHDAVVTLTNHALLHSSNFIV